MSTCTACQPALLCDVHRAERRRMVADQLAVLNSRVVLREPQQ